MLMKRKGVIEGQWRAASAYWLAEKAMKGSVVWPEKAKTKGRKVTKARHFARLKTTATVSVSAACIEGKCF
jgi:hypothetical protein